jgi:LacI family transcriptional regulator, xylobiose transport system transcriptional regulator
MADSKRVTLATIAAETGVSITTISKVLNGRGDVAASTRARVEAQLQRRGYARRGAGRSDFVEVVLHELDTNWSLEVIEGVREIAAESGLTVSLSVSGDRHAPAAEWITDVLRRRPAGVVLVFAGLPPAGRRKLKARGIPFVVLDPAGDPAPGIPAIGSANWQGGLLATRHLTDLGHRAIAAITGPDDMMSALARIDGYRSAMKAANLPVHPEWERYGDFHEASGELHGGELLALDERPTAIFAGSDLQALGVLRAAARHGLEVPRDLSVVGYDDIPLARLTTPALTTVHQPLRRMAEEATRLVLKMRAGDQVEATRLDLATSLVVRESTAPPAGAAIGG